MPASPGGGSIVHISVGGNSQAGGTPQVLALNNAVNPASNVYVLNAAQTAWTSVPGEWLSTAEIAPDGTIWGLGRSRLGGGDVIWTYVNGAWVSPVGSLSNIAVGSASSVYGVLYSCTVSPCRTYLQQWNGTQFVNLPVAPPFTASHFKNAIAAVGDLSLTVLDTTGHIHISTDAGVTWSTIADTANAVTGGGSFMFVLDSTGAAYHVNLLVPALTVTTSGGPRFVQVALRAVAPPSIP